MSSPIDPLLEGILQNAHEAIIVLDERGRVLLANLTAEQVFGRGVAELTGSTIDSYLDDASQPVLREMMEAADRFDGVLPVDKSRALVVMSRREQPFPVRVSLGTFRYEGARRFVLCALDAREHHRKNSAITVLGDIIEDQANRRSEEAMRSARQRSELEQARAELDERDQTIHEQYNELQRLYESAPAPLAHLDANLNFVRVSRRFADLAGRPARKLIGAAAAEIDIECVRTMLPICEKAIQSREPQLGREIALAIPGEAGETQTWIVNCVPAVSGEDLRGVLVAWTDVSAWKKAQDDHRRMEERFRMLSEATFEGVVIHRDGIVLECNHAFATIMSRPQSELKGKTLTECFGSLDDADGFARFVSRSESSNFEGRVRREDDSWLAIEIRSRPIEYEGRPAVVFGVRDITERKQLETRRQHVQRMESLGTLAGGIAHDFNNILAAILGYTELAFRAAPDGSTMRADLSEALAATNRARSLVRQILAFGRSSREATSPIDLGWVVNDGLTAFDAEKPPNVRIVRDTDRACAPIAADAEQIRVALVNLCSNACQAMRETGGEVHVSVREVGVSRDAHFHSGSVEPGRYVRLRVRDTGLGMSPETMERMYEPFFTTHEHGDGSGLGLSTVYGIVRMLGGAIAVESTPGEGTQIDLYFPIADATTGTGSKPGRRSKRIIVVDDGEGLADVIVEALQQVGHRAEGFTNPRHALETFQAAPGAIDLIVTDLTMPQMSGLELAREIRLRRADVPILMMTGYDHLLNEEDAQRLNITEVVGKPFNMVELMDAVERVWSRGARAERKPRG